MRRAPLASTASGALPASGAGGRLSRSTRPGSGRALRHLLQRVLAVPLRQAVDVEVAVEVVRLVLEAAGEVARAAHLDRVALDVLAGDLGVVGAGQRGVRRRDGQAALVGVVEDPALRGQLDQPGVADDAHVPHALVVGAVVDEDLQVDADLVGGQAHALGGALAGEHVVDELRQRVVELGDVLALLVEHGVADHGDGAGRAALAVRPLTLLAVLGVDDVPLVVHGQVLLPPC